MKSRRDEPVCLIRKRFGFLPEAFTWRGRRYDVERVERSWALACNRGRAGRRYFRVRCSRGTFDLYHDLQANAWGVTVC